MFHKGNNAATNKSDPVTFIVSSLTQSVHDLLVRHLALLLLPVGGLGGGVSVRTRARRGEGLDDGSSVHLHNETNTLVAHRM